MTGLIQKWWNCLERSYGHQSPHPYCPRSWVSTGHKLEVDKRHRGAPGQEPYRAGLQREPARHHPPTRLLQSHPGLLPVEQENENTLPSDALLQPSVTWWRRCSHLKVTRKILRPRMWFGVLPTVPRENKRKWLFNIGQDDKLWSKIGTLRSNLAATKSGKITKAPPFPLLARLWRNKRFPVLLMVLQNALTPLEEDSWWNYIGAYACSRQSYFGESIPKIGQKANMNWCQHMTESCSSICKRKKQKAIQMLIEH